MARDSGDEDGKRLIAPAPIRGPVS